jgi:recombination protein RecA
MVAEMQKRGRGVLFIDAEHALDLEYAQKIGVNPRALAVSQPDSGEDAMEICEKATRSGNYGLIVVDSVAALAPQAELEGDMGDSHVGLQARLMSQAMRKLRGATQPAKCTIIFTNQIRTKIGKRFGCFQYNARVVLADGSTEKIGKIVNQKLDVEVMSFDPETGVCRSRPIVNWFKNGRADHFLQITTEKVGGNGRSAMGVTPNHLIFTPDGTRRAGDLEVGDEVLGMAFEQFTPLQRQLALGSVLGDGSLRKTGRYTVSLRVGHGEKQTEYAKWKADLMGDLVSYQGREHNGGLGAWKFAVRPSADLLEICREAYDADGRSMSPTLLRDLDLFGVAIWYMDDGSFNGHYKRWGHGKVEISAKSYTTSELELLADRLEELRIPRPTIREAGILLWSGKRTARFQELLAPYIHPSMDYKLKSCYRGRFIEPDMDPQIGRSRMIPVEVTDISRKPKTRSMTKFDLEVEGDHAYIVDGVGVHNSPETTSGGRALRFYSSVRLDLRYSGKEVENGEVIANRIRVRCKKNKTAPPFKQCETRIVYAEGIDRTAEVLDLAIEKGVIEKAGSWYKLVDDDGSQETIGQGRTTTIEWLNENRERYSNILDRIFDH